MWTAVIVVGAYIFLFVGRGPLIGRILILFLVIGVAVGWKLMRG